MTKTIQDALNNIFNDKEERGFQTASALYQQLLFKIMDGLAEGQQDTGVIDGTPMTEIIGKYMEWKHANRILSH